MIGLPRKFESALSLGARKLGDVQSFEEVARQYDPLIKSMIRQLHLYKDVEDMHQIGLIALWEAYVKFDSKKGAFGGYAKSMVKGRLLTALQKSKKYDDRHVFVKSKNAEENTFSALVETSSVVPFEEETISCYLAGLSERQCFWVEQGLLQGKKTREIAEGEHVSQNTVRTWKKEALKKMQVNAREFQ